MTSIYYERNKEKLKQWYQDNKDEVLKKYEAYRRSKGIKKRVALTADEKRQRKLESSRKRYQKNKSEVARKNKERYATDPEYRKKRADASKRAYEKKGIAPRVKRTLEEKAQDARDRARRYYHEKNDARVKARRDSFGVTEEERKERKRKKAAEDRKKRWHANPEKYKEENKAWAKKNRDYLNAKKRAWMKTPEGIIANRLKQHKRRALECKIEGRYTAQEWQDLCNKYDNKCLCCGEQKELTADHVIPVSKGGSGSIDNIQPLCRSCNSRKNAKTIDYRCSQ